MEESATPVWERLRGADPLRMAAAIPAVAAGGLGLLYAVGAILWTAEQNGAGLAVGRALPLVPLEQVLARGIGTMATVGVVILIAVPIVAWYLRHPPPSRPLGRTAQKALLIAVMAVLVLIGLGLPPVLTIFTLLATGTAAWMSWRRPVVPYSSGQLALLVGAGAVLATLLSAFFDPGPLPKAKVIVDGRPVIEGRLLTATPDTWYVVGAHHRIIGIPSSRVRRASVDSAKHYRPPTSERLFGLELP